MQNTTYFTIIVIIIIIMSKTQERSLMQKWIRTEKRENIQKGSLMQLQINISPVWKTCRKNKTKNKTSSSSIINVVSSHSVIIIYPPSMCHYRSNASSWTIQIIIINHSFVIYHSQLSSIIHCSIIIIDHSSVHHH